MEQNAIPSQGSREPIANTRVTLSHAERMIWDVDSGVVAGFDSSDMDVHYLSNIDMLIEHDSSYLVSPFEAYFWFIAFHIPNAYNPFIL